MWVCLAASLVVGADMGDTSRVHRPVMVEEVMSLLDPKPGETFLDGTVGAAGHSLLMLPRLAPGGTLHGADLDREILAIAQQRLRETGHAFQLHHASYADVGQIEALAGVAFDGVLLDLGVSSLQLDRPERGFSFRQDGPLDMRMDTSRGMTAAELVNETPEHELADLIYQYGEERRSRRIARAIAQERETSSIQGTLRLAEIVRRAVPGPRKKIHPATRTFQALRIAVNGELKTLELGLNRLAGRLTPGGRIAIISFHSLEDRIVKRALLALAETDDYERLTRKPLRPGDMEMMRNRRSRSARLRGLRRLKT